MLQIALCEDETEQAIREAGLIAEAVPELTPRVRSFSSAEALLQAVQAEGYHPRVAVLDIVLGGANGITLGENLNLILPDCSVIYLTAYLQYAPEVYTTRHTYYIMKQDAAQRLGPAIRKALDEQSRDDTLCFRTREGLRFARCREILYLERVLHKTRLQLQHEDCLTTATPAELLGRGGDRFLRCHQSYWVNLDYIQFLRSDSLVLTDGTSLPVSRTYRKALRAQLFAQLSAELKN